MRLLPSLLLYCLLTTILVVNGFKYYIDTERCKTEEMACFVRASCLDSSDSTEKLKKLIGQTLVNGKCDVIMQIKAFSKMKFQFIIQVNATTEDLIPTSAFEILQDSVQFSCGPNGVTAADPSKFTIALVGDPPIFTDKQVFCSFIISTVKPEPSTAAQKKISELFEINSKDVKISYDAASGKQILSSNAEGDSFWLIPIAKCNPDDITTNDDINGDELLRMVDTSYAQMKCDHDETMIITIGPSRTTVNDVKCQGILYKYMSKEDPLGKEIAMGTKFKLHCAKKFCSLCSNLNYTECTGCASPSPSAHDTCRTATCPSNKWRLEDGSVIDSTVQCSQSTVPGQERTAGWFMKMNTKLTEITEGSCSTEFHCPTYSKLTFTCPPGDCVQAHQIFDGAKINCTDGYDLKFGNNTASVELTCKVSNGLYFDASDREVAQYSNVYCQKIIEVVTSPQTGSTGDLPTILGGVGGALIIAVIAIIIVVILRRRRKQKDPMESAAPTPHAAAAGTAASAASVGTAASAAAAASPAPSQDNLKTARSLHSSTPAGNSSRSAPLSTPAKGGSTVEKENEPSVKSIEKEKPAVEKEDKEKKACEPARAESFDEKLSKYHELTEDIERVKLLTTLTSFCHHSLTKPMLNFGSLTQFFKLIKENMTLHCSATWKFIFPVIKILHHYVPATDEHNLKKRLESVVKQIASNMMSHCGIKFKDREHGKETHLRVISFQMALWAGDAECVRLAKTNAMKNDREMDISLRAAVLWYGINHRNMELRMKDRLYVLFGADGRKPWRKNVIGDRVQHYIFALCSYRNRVADDPTESLKQVMAEVHEMDMDKRKYPFTTLDILFAFRGATENPANWPVARDMLQQHTISCVSNMVRPVYAILTTDKDRMMANKSFENDCENLCKQLAHHCVSPSDLEIVKERCAPYARYAGLTSAYFDKYKDRVKNLETLTTHKDRGNWLDEALTASGF